MSYTEKTKRGSKTACKGVPDALIEAAQLIARAKNLIFGYYDANPQLHNCIWDDVFELEIELNASAHRIGNITSNNFIEENFFNIRKETTV